MSDYTRDLLGFWAAMLLGAIIVGLGAAADLTGLFL